jgi:cytochrome c553
MRLTSTLCAIAAALISASAPARSPTDSQVSEWSTTCMSCHGTDGKALGVGLVLGGRSEDYLYKALIAFKDGSRPGSMMPQLVKGFSDEELKSMSAEFAHFK